jgi:DnaJ-domain-containing protein 1
VDALHDVAGESGVDLAQVSPAAPKTSGIRPELAVIETSVTVTGGYFQVEDFLSRLENLIKGADPARVPPRSILVRSVTLGPGGSSAGTSSTAASSATATGSPGELQATIALAVFQLAQSPSAAAPAASGTGAAGGPQVR